MLREDNDFRKESILKRHACKFTMPRMAKTVRNLTQS